MTGIQRLSLDSSFIWQKDYMKRIHVFFVIIEFLLYLTFMSMDLFGGASYQIINSIKLISIFLCFIYTILLVLLRKASSKWLSLSFLFLLFSDYFLLIVDSYTLGVCTFICVQFLYMLYYSSQHENFHGKQLLRSCSLVLLVAMVILIVINAAHIPMDATLVVATIYFILFSSNLIRFYGRYKLTKDRKLGIFTLGLFLYFLCDINVGIFNLAQYVSITNQFIATLYQFSTIAMWMFYLPGIILITLSNCKN